jgi:AcrR family transcriptional regulator
MKSPPPLSGAKMSPVSVNAAQTPRDRLIAAASGLFGRYGINAIGVDAIVEAAGTAKTTLYKAFGSKEKLVETVLEFEGDRWRKWFFEAIDGPGGPARGRLDRIFPALATWFADEGFYGCPLVNAVGENDKFDGRFREIASQHKSKIEARLRDLLIEAGVGRPEIIARQTMLLIEGAIASTLLSRECRAAEIAQGIFEALLKSSGSSRSVAGKTGPQRSGVKFAH